MRKLIVLVLAAGVLFVSPHTPNAYSKVRDPGRYARTSDGNGWSPTDVKQAIRIVVDRWHVAGGVCRAFCIAKHESGFQSHGNDSSCCKGVFQQHEDYWAGRFRRFNPHHGWRLRNAIHNARSNIVVSIRMAHASGWGDWTTLRFCT
jgi:hypothetical protein